MEDCNLETNVTLQSSDGKLYGAHSKNLELYSDAFPAVGSTTSPVGDVVTMTESSTVVDLLLQYMHHRRQPDSLEISLDVLEELAEAVEKYGIFSAMEVCKLRMKSAIPSRPLAVLAYAAKHGYVRLMNEVAPRTLELPFKTVDRALANRPDVHLAWFKFREERLELAKTIFTQDPPVLQHRGGLDRCDGWDSFHRGVIIAIAGKPVSFDYFSKTLETYEYLLGECSYCKKVIKTWEGRISSSHSTHNFSYFL